MDAVCWVSLVMTVPVTFAAAYCRGRWDLAQARERAATERRAIR